MDRDELIAELKALADRAWKEGNEKDVRAAGAILTTMVAAACTPDTMMRLASLVGQWNDSLLKSMNRHTN